MTSVLTEAQVLMLRISERAYLAPAFNGALDRVLQRLRTRGHQPRVFETIRVQRLQSHYFAAGTTHVEDVWHGWHAYGLAADVIDGRAGVDPWASQTFYRALGEATRAEKLTWGGDWTSIVDLPHVQFGPGMKDTPSDLARQLRATGGVAAVWRAVNAGA